MAVSTACEWTTVPIRHGAAGYIEATVPGCTHVDVVSRLSDDLKGHVGLADSLGDQATRVLCEAFSIPLAIGNNTFVKALSSNFFARPEDYVDAVQKSLRYFAAASKGKSKKSWQHDIRFAASHYDANSIRSNNPQLRDRQVYVDAKAGHASYVPPPADRISPLMDDLYRFMSFNHQGVDAVAKATYCMLHFLAIHPLSDGNGRFSRAIFVRVASRGQCGRLYASILLSVIFVKYIDRTYSAILNYCLTGTLGEMREIVQNAMDCTSTIFQNDHLLSELYGSISEAGALSEPSSACFREILLKIYDVIVG